MADTITIFRQAPSRARDLPRRGHAVDDRHLHVHEHDIERRALEHVERLHRHRTQAPALAEGSSSIAPMGAG
ncbi:MAG: hypothetical protein U0271_28550 [Polyangiaceae bacterium]